MEGEQSSGRGGQSGRRGHKGAGRSRGRGRGGRGGFSGSLTNLPSAPGENESNIGKGKARMNQRDQDQQGEQAEQTQAAVIAAPLLSSTSPNDTDITETELCFICAEPVQLYSVAPCNHRTCHVCAVRLRALYKKRECTFCKVSQPGLPVVEAALRS